jgi:hypothetical protein
MAKPFLYPGGIFAGETDGPVPDSDVFSDTFPLPVEIRKDQHIWPHNEFSATVSDAAPIDSDSFSDTLPLTTDSRKDYWLWMDPPAGGLATEDDPSQYVFSDTFQQPELPRRDWHLWEFSAMHDSSTGTTPGQFTGAKLGFLTLQGSRSVTNFNVTPHRTGSLTVQ